MTLMTKLAMRIITILRTFAILIESGPGIRPDLACDVRASAGVVPAMRYAIRPMYVYANLVRPKREMAKVTKRT